MKAAVYRSYGPPDVLKIEEVERPTPTDNQVLVKVHAASINAMDWRRFTMPSLLRRLMEGGLFQPKKPMLGADVAGKVEAVGNNVTNFKPGDDVFGVAPGAFAEYACNGASKFAMKPTNVSFEAAAAVPVAALTALQAIRHAGGIQSGQKVLIQGASGGVGIFTVQLAKYYGAEVTAVCSTRNLEMARSIGADHIIDYTRKDFTQSGQRYDLILAVNGYHSLFVYKRALVPQGIFVCVGGTLPQIFQAIVLGSLISEKGGRRLSTMRIASVNQEDLITLARLLEEGTIAPVIDRVYPLNEIAEAFRYVVDTHAQGKVLIDIA